MDRELTAISTDRSITEWLDRLVHLLLIALLAFAPLALGAVQAWSEQIVVTLAAAITLVFLLKLTLQPTVPFIWSWAYVPMAVFITVAAFQLLPLPGSIVNMFSPNTVSLKRGLLGDLPDATNVLSSMTLTFYSSATRHDLRLVLAVAAIFVVVVNVYREPAQITRLLAAMAAIGGGVALLALAQDVAGNGKIYWLIPTYDQAFSGMFINHSHYGQFMNLSMGAALGLLLVELHQAFRGRKITPAHVAEYLTSPEAKTVKLLTAMMILGAATVFVSLTRGGMISMLLAAAFTTLVLGSCRSLAGHGWIIVLLVLCAFVCVLYVGFDQVYDRLATLRDLDQAEAGRWQMIKGVASSWARFPVFGTGLGTHQVVYPMFNCSDNPGLATHAENEYAQAAEETGFVGLLTLIVFGVILWTQYGRSVARPDLSIRSAAYGLGFGILAILIHSTSDFGQHLPANATLSAVCCGLLIAVARVEPQTEEQPWHTASWLPHGAERLAVLVLAAGVWTWVFFEANAARVAEVHWNKVLAAEKYLDAKGWQSDDQAYKYLITHAADAAAIQPDNIHYRHWLNVYRWRSLERYLDPNTGEAPPEALPLIQRVVDELHRCRPVCPTFGATYCVAGEIEEFVLKDPNGANHIRKGYQLAPCDPVTCFALAQIEAEQGKVDDCFGRLCRAVQLDERYFQRAVRLCADDLGRADLAVRLASNDTNRLAYVSNVLAAAGKPPETGALENATDPPAEDGPHLQLAEQAEAKAFEELRKRCEEPDAPAYVHASLASLYHRSGNLEEAIRHYRRALVKDYSQVGWHYALAQLLAQANRAEEAVHEAQVCLRLRPDYVAARRLIEGLSARSPVVTPPLSGGK